MTIEEKILFIADKVERTRKYKGVELPKETGIKRYKFMLNRSL